MRYYPDQKVLLRKYLKLGSVVKSLPRNKYLVSYYEENKLKYDIITEEDIMDEKEYDVVKNRINTINKLLG
jgi:enolase